MGLFDDIRCRYPLSIPGANDIAYQTKDTPSQYMDRYEIREDGTLWEEKYDTEDQSPRALWLKENPGKPEPEWGFDSLRGLMTRVNKRWEQVADFTGEIRFYATVKVADGRVVDADGGEGWLEWSAYFTKGKLRHLELIASPLDTAQSEATL